MCIYPLGGGTNPATGTELVMNDMCDNVMEKILRMASGIYE